MPMGSWPHSFSVLTTDGWTTVYTYSWCCCQSLDLMGVMDVGILRGEGREVSNVKISMVNLGDKHTVNLSTLNWIWNRTRKLSQIENIKTSLLTPEIMSTNLLWGTQISRMMTVPGTKGWTQYLASSFIMHNITIIQSQIKFFIFGCIVCELITKYRLTHIYTNTDQLPLLAPGNEPLFSESEYMCCKYWNI